MTSTWHERNRAYTSEYKKAYLAKNRDRINATKRARYQREKTTILQRNREWYQANKDKVKPTKDAWNAANLEKRRRYSRDALRRLKVATLTFYSRGEPTCKCCGESHIEFLALDHIEGNGNKHRKSLGSRGGAHFYRLIKKLGYPAGFQVLCHNCNMAKGFYGSCPHTA